MKTKCIIDRILELDPTGEMEATVGNIDILHIDILPAYYDGPQQILIRNTQDQIVGGKFNSEGNKIVISPIAISDLIFEHDDFEVDFSNLNPATAERYKKTFDKIRADYHDLKQNVEFESFYSWVKSKVIEFTNELEDLKGIAKTFFYANLSYQDLLPAGHDSYINRRIAQWDQEIEVVFGDELQVEIKKVT